MTGVERHPWNETFEWEDHRGPYRFLRDGLIRAIAQPGAERLFDQPVFAAMKGDDRRPAARPQHFGQ